jgi:hypothetical protein
MAKYSQSKEIESHSDAWAPFDRCRLLDQPEEELELVESARGRGLGVLEC